MRFIAKKPPSLGLCPARVATQTQGHPDVPLGATPSTQAWCAVLLNEDNCCLFQLFPVSIDCHQSLLLSPTLHLEFLQSVLIYGLI